MAYGDRKIRKRRALGCTKADERHWQAQQRRERKARLQAKADREAMLAGMSAGERESFFAAERDKAAEADRNRKQRAAENDARNRERQEVLIDESRLTAGYLQSEIATAITYKEAHGRRDGDWLEDPIAAVTTGYGFGEEVKTSTGIKLQVNLCLDCSNSMLHNGLTEVSLAAMRTLYLALRNASLQFPAGTLVLNSWLWAQGEKGKAVTHLESSLRGKFADDNLLGPMANLPHWNEDWSGEATWIHPLLDRLDRWEQREGDAGAYRLDLIISDGVLDHPTDARKGDEIQDRRNGNLQSVVLNFLPMSEWAEYRVPNRCVQYPADVENLFALMRQVFGEWIVSLI